MADEQPAAAAVSNGRVRVLVIDDSAVSRNYVISVVERLAGIEIVAAESGTQGVRAIREGGISLVICDYEMPDLSGLQVLRFARQAHSALEMPVLMLTSRDEPEIKVKAFRAGANDYIPKHAQPEELLARVGTQIELLKLARQLADARASKAEQQKFEAIGHLAEGLAHELNTPAQYISDNLSFLAEGFDALAVIIDELRGLPTAAAERSVLDAVLERVDYAYMIEQLPRCIAESKHGIEHVARVVSVMREFARPGEQQRRRQSLNEIICGAIAVTRGQWHQVAELEVQLLEGLPAIDCVAVTIKQVVLLAVMSSVHALAAGCAAGQKGRLHIATLLDAAGWAVIEISHNGRGIGSEQVARALRPVLGQRASDDDAQGLAHARLVIVEQHQGQLEVNSGPDGTQLRMRLPLPQDTVADAAALQV